MNDVTKLPKWAQEHINDLRRERDLARMRLKEFTDNQTKSAFWVEEDRGKNIHYIQTDQIHIGHTETDYSIRLTEHGLTVWAARGQLTVHPDCSNVIRIRTIKHGEV